MLKFDLLIKKTPFELLTVDGTVAAFFTQLTIAEAAEHSKAYTPVRENKELSDMEKLGFINKKRLCLSVKNADNGYIFANPEELDSLPLNVVNAMVEQVDLLNPWPVIDKETGEEETLDSKKD